MRKLLEKTIGNPNTCPCPFAIYFFSFALYYLFQEPSRSYPLLESYLFYSCTSLAALRFSQSLLLAKCSSLQLMQRGVVCLQGLPDIKQVGQQWSLDKCAAAQNLQALVEHLSPIWPNF
jgi:hypothetical protein